jgi:hypothetical protein
VCVALKQVSARVDPVLLRRARKALAASTTSETIQKALALVAEKAAHDRVIRRYDGVGTPDAFREE